MSDPNPNPNPLPDPKPEHVQMTQAELDALIAGRVGAALAQAEKKRTTVPAETLKELDELRAERAERERKKLEEKGEYQKALDAQAAAIRDKYEPELKARDERLAKRDERLRKEVVTNQLLSAAANGSAINAAQVVALLEHSVKLNEDFEPQVVDPAGNPRFVGDKPMTPAQLVDEFLRNNAHFVKATPGVKSGQATGGATRNGTVDQSATQKLEAEIADLTKKYQETRDINVMTQHRLKSQELKRLKASAA